MVEVTKKAIELSKEQQEISIAEFFEKNRHLLGYNNPQKALLTIVREGVDNSLDACEAANILPNILVEIHQTDESVYKIIIQDNGPGIKKENVPYVFGKLLFGSKFRKLAQTRGQQGIGISGAVLYAQLTTGKPAKIYSSIGDGKVVITELKINIENNTPEVVKQDIIEGEGHGIRVELFVKGKYVKGKQSVKEYLLQTAIMNPHAQIKLVEPDGNVEIYERVVDVLPTIPKEIKPHPHGIELGILIRMLKNTKSRTIVNFLVTEFSRVSKKSALDIIGKAGLDPKTKPDSITHLEAERLLKIMHNYDFPSPPTDCLSPVGKEAIIKGLKKELLPEYTVAVSRKPKVYRGFPFLVEVGIAYGGNIKIENGKLYRYANRVPLLYEQSSCALTRAFQDIDWRRYNIKKSSNGFPEAPIIVSIHFASVWVPYTSEGKEALSSYPEIIKEVKLALQDALRDLQKYISKLTKASHSRERKRKFYLYGEELASALEELTSNNKEEIKELINKLLDKNIKDYDKDIEKMQDEDYIKSKESPLEEKLEDEIDSILSEVKEMKTKTLKDFALSDKGEEDE